MTRGVAAQNNTEPSGWSKLPLGEIGRWLSGGTPSLAIADYWGGDLPWVSPKDMKTPRLQDAIDHISNSAVAAGATVLPAGAILMVVRGMILAHSMPVARAERPLSFNQDIKAVVCRDRVDSEFLLYWLLARARRLLSLTTESTHGTKRLPTETLFREVVVCPSVEEQRAIARVLSDVDALIAKLDQLIAKRRDLKQAAMQQLLTGQRRLSGFSEPWGERALQSVVTRLEAGVSVRSVEGDAGGSECFVLKTSAVADGNFDASERKPVISADRGRVRCPVRAGTVLVSRMNTPDLVGEVGFVDRDHPNSFLPDRLWAASVPKGAVSARWLSYLLSSREYKQRLKDVATGTSGSMKNISKGAFLGISVKVPTLDEQNAIAQVLSDMDAELSALEARRDKTRQLKQGMMQALLTGRIRLV